LAYLQDVNDSFQRAAVYARLGDLFDGITDPRVAATTDTSKARMYYRKALEAEPERIGWATLHARGFFATDANTPEARFASYMDYYQWLLAIDEKTLKEKLLPTRPARKAAPAPPEDEMRRKMRERFQAAARPGPQTRGEGFLGEIKSRAETAAHNLVNEATGQMALDPTAHLRSRERAIRYLRVLRERFPGTSVAEHASAELTKIARDPGDDLLVALENRLDARWRRAFIPTASHADANDPHILDLLRGRVLLPPARLHTEATFTYLSRQGRDYLAWDDAFVVPNGYQLAVVHPTMPGTRNVARDQWSVNYELPQSVVDPYHLWLTATSGRRYLLHVTAVKPEGVSFFYRSVTNEEFQAETRAAAVPETNGKEKPPEGTR
jgi:hypothetical protein